MAVDKERTAILILPFLERFLQLCLDLGQFFCNSLSHLLFAEQLSWIASLALVTACHKSRGILAGLLKLVALRY
jgi:hypothetical protein